MTLIRFFQIELFISSFSHQTHIYLHSHTIAENKITIVVVVHLKHFLRLILRLQNRKFSRNYVYLRLETDNKYCFNNFFVNIEYLNKVHIYIKGSF